MSTRRREVVSFTFVTPQSGHKTPETYCVYLCEQMIIQDFRSVMNSEDAVFISVAKHGWCQCRRRRGWMWRRRWAIHWDFTLGPAYNESGYFEHPRANFALTVSPSMLCAGEGGACSGGAWSGGMWYPSMHWGRPPLSTESHMPWEKNITLPQLSCGR